MNNTTLVDGLNAVAAEQGKLAEMTAFLAEQVKNVAEQTAMSGGGDHGFFLTGLTIFILACFVGYYVVWNVTPALHSPLMAVTNAVSSVIIVGALMAAGLAEESLSTWFGLAAVFLASVNIFGGFIVTQRMLQMYKKKGS